MKEYAAQGLVVDTVNGERLILCQTGYEVFRWICIGNDINDKVYANRLNEKEKYLPGKVISRKEIVSWLSESGSGWEPKRIKAPKKLRIVCS